MTLPSSSAYHRSAARSSRARTACFVIAGIFGFTAGAAEQQQPSAAKQPSSLEEWEAITQPLLSSIEAEETENGPFSPNLVDMLMRLGLTYQEYDEHVLAVAVLDRALFLKRFNEGLYGLDQAPLVKRLIASELEIGRSASAGELEQRLLELARRAPTDPRAAPIFREAAERELGQYEQYLRGEIPPSLTIGFDDSESPRGIARSAVWRARRHYSEAIWTLERRPRENKAELSELEEELARTYYLEASDERARLFQGPDDPVYGLGLVSFKRRIAYATTDPTPLEYAHALVDLADWSLLFSRNGTAVKRYAEAHALLVEQGVSTTSIETLFPSETPVFLPTFEATPLAGAVVDGSTGYVDVDFEISKYGQPRKVSVVGVAGNDAAAMSKQIANAIDRARFRPSPATDGATEYRLRYALGDGSLTPRR